MGAELLVAKLSGTPNDLRSELIVEPGASSATISWGAADDRTILGNTLGVEPRPEYVLVFNPCVGSLSQLDTISCITLNRRIIAAIAPEVEEPRDSLERLSWSATPRLPSGQRPDT